MPLQETSQYIAHPQGSDLEAAGLKVSVSKQKFIFDNKECLMVIIEDLTTAQNLDRERQKNESLQIAQACISHEMKTPLRTMSMYSDYMLKNCTPDQLGMLRSIKTGSQLMLFNVMNTLDFA
jgi:signal transduction histidine kinase